MLRLDESTKLEALHEHNGTQKKGGGDAFVHSWLCSLLLLDAILYVCVIDIMTSLISKTDHAVEGKTWGAACIHPG